MLEGEWTFRRLFQTPFFVFAQMPWVHRNTWYRRAVCLVERGQKAKVTQATMRCCACLVSYFDYSLIYYYYKLVNTVRYSLHFHFLGDFCFFYMIHMLFENTGSFMMHIWQSNVQSERDESVQMVRAVLLPPEIIITCTSIAVCATFNCNARPTSLCARSSCSSWNQTLGTKKPQLWLCPHTQHCVIVNQ